MIRGGYLPPSICHLVGGNVGHLARRAFPFFGNRVALLDPSGPGASVLIRLLSARELRLCLPLSRMRPWPGHVYRGLDAPQERYGSVFAQRDVDRVALLRHD